MKRFDAFLTEQETEAHKKAKAMGLEYRGFGYWADPHTGEISHRSSGDKLEPVGGGLEAKAGPGGEDAAGGAPMGGAPMGGGAGGEVPLGEVKPGEEIARRDTSWEPGPDGSTDIGKGKDPVDDDVFVGKNNESGWTAGADGSNYTNWSFDQFQEAAIMEGTGMPAAQEARMRGFVSDGHGMWFDKDGTPMARTVDGELEYLSGHEREVENAKIVARNMRKAPGVEMTGDEDARAGAAFMQKIPQGKRTDMMHDYLRDKGLEPQMVDPKFNPLAAKGKVPAMPEPGATPVPDGMGRDDQIKRLNDRDTRGERTFKDALSALDKMSPEDKEKIMADLAKTKPNEFQGMNQGEYTKGLRAYKDIQRIPAKGKDLEKVKKMNEVVQEFISDPDYDLSEDNRAEEIGEGAFGTVYLSQGYEDENGYRQDVIKNGDIGRDEMEALFLMKDNPAFPTLLNAEFETPFKHQSSAYNNPMDVDDERADGEGNYFNPGDESDFEKRFVTARGTYAMSMATGEAIADALYRADEYTQEKVTDNVWNARADLHKAGIAHGDMHGGNIFVDLDEDEMPVTILDLGLAQVSRLAALMEGIAGLSEEDYQLSNLVTKNNLSEDQFQRLEANWQNLQEKIREDFDGDLEAGDISEYEIDELLEGGIRMSDDDLGQMLETFGFEDDQLQEYIDILYDGFGSGPPKSRKSKLEDRMAKAWEGLWDEIGERGNMSGEMARTAIKNANYFRKDRGESPIGIKGLDVNDDD